MRGIKTWLWKTRRRKIGAGVTIAALVCASAALAYFIISSGSGDGQQSLGTATGTLALHPSWSDGLTPGGQADLHVTVDNPNSATGTINSLTIATTGAFTVTGNTGPCDASVFYVHWPSGQNNTGANQTYMLPSPVTVPANTTGQSLDSAFGGTLPKVEFPDNGADQSGCEGATLHLHITSN